MKNHFLICLSACLLTLLFACEQDKDCLKKFVSTCDSTNTPATALVNQEVPIEVRFSGTSGCLGFDFFEEKQDGKMIEVILHAKYEGCICTMDIPTRTAIYTFKASEAGTYYLKFWQQAAYKTDTIVVSAQPE